MPKGYIYALDVSPESYIYATDIGFVIIYRVGGSIKGEVKSKIVKISTKATVDDTKKVLTRALSARIGNTNNNVNDFGDVPIGQVGNGIKVVVDSKIVEVLTEAGVGDTEDIVVVWGPEG